MRYSEIGGLLAIQNAVSAVHFASTMTNMTEVMNAIKDIVGNGKL